MKYKKLFAFSVLIAAASAFMLPQTQYGFGWPFHWLEYYGQSSVNHATELFQPRNIGDVFFNLWNLLLGALLIYVLLRLVNKGLNQLTKDNKIGEK